MMATVRPRPAALTPPPRPMLVAHRGASSDIAEHTLGAYEEAVRIGADALECDVRLTRDGHLVCVHDRTVNRTSDGRGVVSELDLASLDRLDFTSWHKVLPGSADELVSDNPYLAGVAVDRDERGGVLTLEKLLGLVHDSGPDVKLLIETKHPTRYAGLVEKTLVEQLARFGWAGRPGPPEHLRQPVDDTSRVIVMSFAPTAVRRVKLLAPDIPTVLLLERLMPQRKAGLLPAGVPIAGPGLHVLQDDPDFVARMHARGHRVFVWTVNEPAEVEFVLGLGVDTVISDRPREVRARLDRITAAG
jgi:glycerophosphoryl diester phosphodiesterase